MSLPPIILRILAQGARETSADINDVAGALDRVGQAGSNAAQGADEAQRALDGVKASGIERAADQTESLKSQLSSIAGEYQQIGEGTFGGKFFYGASQGAGGLMSQLRDVVQNVKDVKAAYDAASKAADGGEEDAPAQAASDVADATGEAAAEGANLADTLVAGAEAAQDLSDKAGAIRNFGAGLAAAGATGIALSRHLQSVAAEGKAVEARLESILKQQGRAGDLDQQNEVVQDITVRGHFDDDDPIREGVVLMNSYSVQTAHMSQMMESAARQARTMGISIEEVSNQLGKAYNTGQVGMLKKSGVTLSEDDIKRVQDAYARSAAEGQALFVQIVGKAISDNTVKLEDSLTDAQKAANDAARALDDFQTAMGTGAGNAQKQIDGLTASVLGLITSNPALAEGAGYLLTWGSYGMSAVGGLLALGGQIAQVVVAVQSLKIAKLAGAAADATSATAAGADAAAQTANAAATGASGAAAAATTPAHGALAAAENTAAAAANVDAAAQTRLAGATAAVGTASVGATGAVAAGTAATGAAGAAATGAATGFSALAGGVLAAVAPFAALAAAAVAVGIAIPAAHHALWRYFGQGKDVHANIEAGQKTDGTRLGNVNAERTKKGLRAMTSDEFTAYETADDELTDEHKAAIAKLEADDSAAKAQRQAKKDADAQQAAMMASLQTPASSAAPAPALAPSTSAAPTASPAPRSRADAASQSAPGDLASMLSGALELASQAERNDGQPATAGASTRSSEPQRIPAKVKSQTYDARTREFLITFETLRVPMPRDDDLMMLPRG